MSDADTQKLANVIREALELPPGTDPVTTSQLTTAQWDSMAHVILMGAIESEFGLQIDAADSLDLTSYVAIARYLEARGL